MTTNKYQDNLRERAEAIAKISYPYFDSVSDKMRKSLIDKSIPIAAYVLSKESDALTELYKRHHLSDEHIKDNILNAGLIPTNE